MYPLKAFCIIYIKYTGSVYGHWVVLRYGICSMDMSWVEGEEGRAAMISPG